MIKTQYQKEIIISGPQSKGATTNKKAEVLKIQSWLNLYSLTDPASGTATGIDGNFGPGTELAVKNFQKVKNLPQTGTVDIALFGVLCLPMLQAFTTRANGVSVREVIVHVANQHLAAHAFELCIKDENNSGPWVRAYMDGNEGEPWFWCMGFVQTMIDQAASQLDKNFKKLMPLSYSCDTIGTYGAGHNQLIRSSDIRNNPSLVKPGDIFLVQKSPNDWFHTGLVTAIHNDVFETIEGNTNTDGSHNGNGVYKRVRNFRQSKLDVFSVEVLVN